MLNRSVGPESVLECVGIAIDLYLKCSLAIAVNHPFDLAAATIFAPNGVVNDLGFYDLRPVDKRCFVEVIVYRRMRTR